MTTDRMVAWLRETMDAAEQIARATTPVPRAGEWVATRDKHAEDDAPLALIQGRDEDGYDWLGESYRSGLPVIAHAAEWQDEAEANLRHIALNDPAAVLRQVDRHRKILAECEAAFDWDNWGAASLAETVIRNLAEAWGWPEETT